MDNIFYKELSNAILSYEGGWGEFRLARAEAKPRRPARSEQNPAQKLSFSFLLEEKEIARQIKKCEENFFAEQRAKRAAAGRSVSFAQRRFAHFQTKGTKLDFLIFCWGKQRVARRAERRGEQTIALASKKSGSPIWCCNHTLCSNLFRTADGLICAPRPLPAVAGAKTKNFPYLSYFPRRGVWGEPTKNGKEFFGFASSFQTTK